MKYQIAAFDKNGNVVPAGVYAAIKRKFQRPPTAADLKDEKVLYRLWKEQFRKDFPLKKNV